MDTQSWPRFITFKKDTLLPSSTRDTLMDKAVWHSFRECWSVYYNSVDNAGNVVLCHENRVARGRRDTLPPAARRLDGDLMGKIPDELRIIIARNIRECRATKYPGRGGGKKCAEAFGVSPQQWSPWERGARTPDEERLSRLAGFFGVTVEYLRRDNRVKPEEEREPDPSAAASERGCFTFMNPRMADDGADGRTVYVPVFVLLPNLPEDMSVLCDQFNAAMNGGKISGGPSA